MSVSSISFLTVLCAGYGPSTQRRALTLSCSRPVGIILVSYGSVRGRHEVAFSVIASMVRLPDFNVEIDTIEREWDAIYLSGPLLTIVSILFVLISVVFICARCQKQEHKTASQPLKAMEPKSKKDETSLIAPGTETLKSGSDDQAALPLPPSAISASKVEELKLTSFLVSFLLLLIS